jgi:hypothetical protein
VALSASFVADFSSFIGQTNEAVAAMQGFKLSAEELGPGMDRGLDDTLKKYEQVGRQTRQLATDVVAASSVFIAAYTEEQDAVQRLTTALATQGNATPAIIDSYAAMATQFQSTTKYADEAVIAAQATLTTIGKVGPEQMQLAMTAVTNLASALDIDLNTAASMVSKTIASGNENFGKLAPLLGDAAEKGMSTADMLQAINDKTGPAAANELQTYNGQIANMNNQMSDLQEMVGGVLVETLTTVLGLFRSLPDGVQTFVVAVVGIGTALAPVLVSLSSLVSILATTGIGAGFMTAMGAIVTVLTGPVGIVIAIGAVLAAIVYNWDAIVGYTKALYEGIKTWLVDKFNGLVAGITGTIEKVAGAFSWLYNTVVGHSIVPDMIDGIGSEFSRLDSVMVQPVSEATAAVNAHLQLMAAQMRANAILNENSLFTTSGQLERVAKVFDASVANAGGGGGGGGGGPVTFNNTFNIVDTESNIARRVSDILMGQIRSGTQLGMA